MRNELQPGIYTFKEVSEALLSFLQVEYPGSINVINIEFDDITKKTELIVGEGIKAIRFDEKSFFLELSLVLLQVGIINTIKNTLVRKL